MILGREVIGMKALFQNPIFNFLHHYRYAPIIATLMAWGVGGKDGLVMALSVITVLTIVIGAIGLSLGVRKIRRRRRIEKMREEGHYQFLCPHCLHFGEHFYECGVCSAEIQRFQVDTEDEFIQGCVECPPSLLPKKIEAMCSYCNVPSEAEQYHRRKVEVLVTLTTSEFKTLLKCTKATLPETDRQRGFLFNNHSNIFRYVLNFTNVPTAKSLRNEYYIWKWVDAVWLDVDQSDVLTIARDLDTLSHRLALTEQQRRRLTIFVRQAELDSVLRLRLEQQFGQIHYDISPEQLFYDDINSSFIGSRGKRVFK